MGQSANREYNTKVAHSTRLHALRMATTVRNGCCTLLLSGATLRVHYKNPLEPLLVVSDRVRNILVFITDNILYFVGFFQTAVNSSSSLLLISVIFAQVTKLRQKKPQQIHRNNWA